MTQDSTATTDRSTPGLKLSGRVVAWLRRELSGDDLQSQITLAIAIAAMVPMIVAVCVVVSYQGIEYRRGSQRQVQTAVHLGGATLEEYLGRHVQALEFVGRQLEADSGSLPDMQQDLLDVHAVYTSFLTLILADRNGVVVATSQIIKGQPAIVRELHGQTVWDRDYFRHAMGHDGVQVSGVFEGRGFGDETLVAVSRSVLVDGDARYVIQGAIPADVLMQRVQSRAKSSDICIAVVDALGTIVGSTDPGRYQPLSAAPASWLGGDPDSDIVAEPSIGGWFVVGALAKTPGRLSTDQTTQIIALSTLLMGLIVAYLVGRWIAGRVNGPVNGLIAEIRQFDLETLSEAELQRPQLDWPAEIRSLRAQFMKLLAKMIRARDSQNELLAQSEELRFALHDEVMSRQAIIQEKTVALERANQTLERLARIDGLTGLCNRRVFDEELARTWRIAVRDQQPLSVVLIDVDHFKAYNDHYGHLSGDDCLRAVARVLEDAARRPGDLAARFGGEEFALLLPHTDLAGALRIGQLVVEQVRDLQIQHEKAPTGILSISAGVAQVQYPHADTPDKLLATADSQLYVAKETGRNRCVG